MHIQEGENKLRKKVIIWGCGTMGKQVLRALYDNYNMEVIAYTDSRFELFHDVYSIPVIEPYKIIHEDYDYVLVAVSSFASIKEIEKILMDIGVPEEKIESMVLNPLYFDAFMDQRMFWIRDFSKLCYEKELDGNVAECGVFRGDSAKFINKFFYDKTLYLFDTFEGFKKTDIEYEMRMQEPSYINGRFTNKEVFTNTDIELMMGKMLFPENIKIHKGHFPETAKEIKDQFCFVNLDMDLYMPMLEGLRFFWSKMVNGGCILLHDYFHPELPGVKKAVDEFEKELGITLYKVPVGDGCSVAIIND